MTFMGMLTYEPALNNNGTIAGFRADNNSALCKSKAKVAGRTGNDGRKC